MRSYGLLAKLNNNLYMMNHIKKHMKKMYGEIVSIY